MSQRPPLPAHTHASHSPCRQLVHTQSPFERLSRHSEVSLVPENRHPCLTNTLTTTYPEFNASHAERLSPSSGSVDMDSLLARFEEQARGSSRQVCIENASSFIRRLTSACTERLDELVARLQQVRGIQRERNTRQNAQIERITISLTNTEAVMDSWTNFTLSGGGSNGNEAR
ncbi:hypothetical protein CKAH01_16826 [Colletotrichum kahawae]|uniref:Uncharacterized protein n=1 Tax=Colletotrichum kahawae TaxID=34407 RepID=A0AAD9YDZ1_COLKA|nr:hypothetical protein CKAH01_16826 [Colletotrichum kahawae]